MSPELPPERAHLAKELTRLRQRTGLSLVALANRTTASKSSWQRYLNGAQLPPREVVRELCVLARTPPGRLLALWELAEAARQQPPPADATPAAAPTPLKRRTRKRRSAVFGLLGMAAAGVAFLGAPDRQPEGLHPGCEGAECTGRKVQPNACSIASSSPDTVAERKFDGGTRVDIRYSAGCDASWARVWFGEVGDRVELTAPGQETQSVRIADKYDAEGYLGTRMAGGGPGGIRACLVSAADGERQCFTS